MAFHLLLNSYPSLLLYMSTLSVSIVASDVFVYVLLCLPSVSKMNVIFRFLIICFFGPVIGFCTFIIVLIWSSWTGPWKGLFEFVSKYSLMVLHKQSIPYMASSIAWQLSNYPHKHTKAWCQKMYLCFRLYSNNPNFPYNPIYWYQIYYFILLILSLNSTLLKPSLFILGNYIC